MHYHGYDADFELTTFSGLTPAESEKVFLTPAESKKVSLTPAESQKYVSNPSRVVKIFLTPAESPKNHFQIHKIFMIF